MFGVDGDVIPLILLLVAVVLLLYPISIKPLIYIFKWHLCKTITFLPLCISISYFGPIDWSIRPSVSFCVTQSVSANHHRTSNPSDTMMYARRHTHHNVNADHLVTFFHKSFSDLIYICIFMCLFVCYVKIGIFGERRAHKLF